jgi:menaquinone-specific isochorismate synthase
MPYSTATVARGDGREQLLDDLQAAVRGAKNGEIAVASMPLPRPRASFPSVAELSWASGKQRCYACGEAALLQSHGANRFTDIEAQASQLFERLHGDASPRLFGGFAFDERDLSDTVWADLAGARFVLPRWQLISSDHGTELIVCVPRDRVPPTGQLENELDRWLALSEAPPRSSHSTSADQDPELARLRTQAATGFRERVAAIVEAIDSGPLQKVVTAWRSDIALPAPIHVPSVMRRLEKLYPECFRFVIPAGESVLLGAPPELLVRVDDRAVASEALAGSIASDLPEAGRRLLDSNKDRAEQDLVVREIESQLAPVCSELSIPAQPEIRALRHLLHLRSQVSGTLMEHRHVVDLVARLHPTPAVGGTPRELARDWLASNEDQVRGWYAAPVGWFDAAGNGEFAVAIRTALVRGQRAHLYAGAGIVSGSDPDAELEETVLKQRAMLDTLGVHA